jgi:hypothetical protein
VIVVMEPKAPEDAIEAVVAHLVRAGFAVHRSSGSSRTILGAVGDVEGDALAIVRDLPRVADVFRVSDPHRLASRAARREPTIVEGRWGAIGGGRPWIAIELHGPFAASLDAKMAGFDAVVARGEAATAIGAAPVALDRADEIAFVARPDGATEEGWLAAAERELAAGRAPVVLLESGSALASDAETFDVARLVRTKERTHLPVVVDASAVARRSRRVAPIAASAIAAGADGVIVRAFAGPEDVLPPVPATLSVEAATSLARALCAIARARG